MQKALRLARKGFTILIRRFRTQGIPTTLLWMYGRGLPGITGVPLLRFSRVTPQLFVGPQFNARGKKLLELEGIDSCVNMRIERDDAASGLALTRYLHLPTVDDTAISREHLERGIAFIREVINGGGKVYIHCGAGVGRAPTMAAAYLIAEGHTLDEALRMIRAVRPFIAITPPQMEQLRQYAERHFAERQYAERHFAERQYAEPQLAERQFTEQQFTERQFTDQQIAEQQLSEQQTAERQAADRRSTADQPPEE